MRRSKMRIIVHQTLIYIDLLYYYMNSLLHRMSCRYLSLPGIKRCIGYSDHMLTVGVVAAVVGAAVVAGVGVGDRLVLVVALSFNGRVLMQASSLSTRENNCNIIIMQLKFPV